MSLSNVIKRARTRLPTLAATLLLSSQVSGSTLFLDDFNGNSLNQEAWRLPTGDGTFFGRTQIKPPSYAGRNVSPVVAGGTVTLQLDTYNPSGPGSFWGQEIQTRQTFLPGANGVSDNGVSFETRMRFNGAPAAGLVGGFFTWGFDGSIRDEIDVELLTNDLNGDRYFTNLYNDTDFNNLGLGGFINTPGYDMSEWNTYEILWLPDRIQWFLNGAQVREQLAIVDGNPSELRLNIWAPNEGFREAYSRFLQPAFNAEDNRQYQLEIDYVKVSDVPLPPALLLFSSALALLGFARGRR